MADTAGSTFLRSVLIRVPKGNAEMVASRAAKKFAEATGEGVSKKGEKRFGEGEKKRHDAG